MKKRKDAFATSQRAIILSGIFIRAAIVLCVTAVCTCGWAFARLC
jgi:hypothetical protein